MSKQKYVQKKYVIMVFCFTFIIHILPLFSKFSMKLVSDNLGVMLGAARLAGLDWSNLEEVISYYGQGFYFIYYPLLKLTSDPYIIYWFILISCKLFLSMFSCFIYYTAVKCYDFDNNYITVIISILCTSFLYGIDKSFTNELPSFFIIWLCNYLLLLLCNKDKDKVNINKYTILLVCALSLGLLIHTRLIVLVIAISLIFILYFFCCNVWIINAKIFYPLIILGYSISSLAKKIIVRVLWHHDSAKEILNATIAGQIPKFSINIKVWMDCIMGNVYKLIIDTDGVAIILIILFCIIIWKMITTIFKKKRSELQKISRKQSVIVLVYGVCILVTIFSLYFFYGKGIQDGYEEEMPNSLMSGLTYLRYYIIYFGPLFLTLNSLIKSNSKALLKLAIPSLLIFLVVSLYISGFIIPKVFYFESNFSKIGGVINNYTITIIVTTILLIIFFITIHMNKIQWFYIYMLGWMIVVKGINMTPTSVGLQLDEYNNAVYPIIQDVEKKGINLPNEIYVTRGIGSTQFVFNRYKVIMGIPDENIEGPSLVVSNTPNDVECSDLTNRGYIYYVLDENECLWVKDAHLQEEISIFSGEWLIKEECVNPIILELQNLIDVETVFLEDDVNAEVYHTAFPEINFRNISSLQDINLKKSVILWNDKPDDKFVSYITIGTSAITTNDQNILDVLLKKGYELKYRMDYDVPLSNMYIDGRRIKKDIISIDKGKTIYGPYLFIFPAEYEIIIQGENVYLNNYMITGNNGNVVYESELVSSNFNESIIKVKVTNVEENLEIIINNNTTETIYINSLSIHFIN